MIQQHVPQFSDAAKGQQVFRLENGPLIKIEITKKVIEANKENLVPMPHQALRVRAWQLNDDGTDKLDAAGKVIEMPHRIETLIEASIAEGTIDLNAKIVEFTMTALERAKNYLIVKAAMDRIPVAQ